MGLPLEDLQPRRVVRGVHPDGPVTVVGVRWFGSEAVELTYKTPAGAVADELLCRGTREKRAIAARRRAIAARRACETNSREKEAARAGGN